jgi:hypothetical protein
MRGFVPEAELRIVRVCDSREVCSSEGIATAITEMIEDPPDLMLIGIAGPLPTDAEKVAIEAITALGTVVVAPVGNTGDADGVGFPARLSNVIGVGATDADSVVAAFSASSRSSVVGGGYGDLTLVAPGTNIPSLGVSGSIELRSGTSQAAAVVTGLLAVLVSNGFTSLEAAECLVAAVKDLEDPIEDGSYLPGWDRYSGYGEVSAPNLCPGVDG